MQANERVSHKRHGGIRAHLIAAVLALLLISIVLVSGIWYFSMSSIIARDALRSTQAGVASIRAQLDGFLRSAINVANQMSYSNTKYLPVIEKGPFGEGGAFNTQAWELESFMGGFFAFSEHIRGIVIISPSGYLFQSGLYVSPNYGMMEKPFVMEVLRGQARAVFELQNDRMYSSISRGQMDTLSVLTPIKMQGKVYGAVMLNMDYAVITELIRRTALPRGARIIALLEDGRTLVDSDHPTITELKENDFALPPELKTLNDSDWPEGVRKAWAGGQRVQVVREYSEYSGITLMGIMEEKALLSSTNEILSLSLVGLLIVALPLMGILVVLIHRLTRGLRALRNTMVSVAQEDIGVRAVVHGKDEVAELALAFNHMMERMEQLLEDMRSKEREKRKAERDVFRAQINPHFLYNTLGTIRYLATLRGARNIEHITTLLIQLLRASLDDTRELIPLHTEVEFALNYMSLQKYRYLDDVQMAVDIAPDAKNALVPRMLLQPLLENALLHGFEGTKKSGTIHVMIGRSGGSLVIQVHDNGKGIPQERLERLLDSEAPGGTKSGHGSIGVRNVHRRLQLAFGEACGLQINSREGEYTEVTAVMPYIMESESENEHQGNHC